MRSRAGKGRLPCQHLVAHHCQRVDIGPCVNVAFARDLFRRHVARRADAGSDIRKTVAAGCFVERAGDTEIGEQCVAVLQEDVFRLDVAVDDTSGVCAGERSGGLGQNADGGIDWELRLAIEQLAE